MQSRHSVMHLLGQQCIAVVQQLLVCGPGFFGNTQFLN